MFLSPTDLAALTGYSRRSAQLRWLKAHAWPHEIGGDGRPKVLTAYVERRLGGVDSPRREPQLRLPVRKAQ